MINSEHSSPTKKPKRTRICGPQSKNACLTCKARRVKCDEEKPHCLRCAGSGRVCEGYREKERHNATKSPPLLRKASSGMSFDIRALIEPKPAWAHSTRCTGSERQHHCAQRGIDLLIFNSFSSFGESGVVLEMLLLQMCYSIPSVHAAATTLGAVHEMQASYKSGSPVNQAFAASQYQLALRCTRQDLGMQPHGPIPLILVCFILSVVELFLQQELNALSHLQGAFGLLQHQRELNVSSGRARSNTDLSSPEDHIDILLHTIDSQTCSYAMSKPPELPAIAMPPILPSKMDLSSAHVVLVRLIHVCYNFTSTNYKFKYQPQFTGTSIYIQQGRLIAHLSIWLERFNLTVLPTLRGDMKSPSHAKSYFHALTLRMTALSTLVYLSCVLSPYETAYDAHASRFEQIVADGEALMSGGRDPSPCVTGRDGRSFAAGPGVIQPLFMAAYKYRDPLHRRRAIRLLSSAGCEGPWSGPREARITSRIMDLEEGAIDDSWLALKGIFPKLRRSRVVNEGLKLSLIAEIMAWRHSPGLTDDLVEATQTPFNVFSRTKVQRGLTDRTKLAGCMTDITELARIHGMGLSMDCEDGRPAKRVNVRFSRCLNIEDMLSYRCGHESGRNQNLDLHTQGPCADNIHWEIWTERLEF